MDKNKDQESKSNLIDLKEEELVTYDGIAEKEEQNNIDRNYKILGNVIKQAEKDIPYPEITKYSTAIDYDDIQNLKIRKDINQESWDIIDKHTPYYDNGHMHIGHVCVENENYFIIESSSLRSIEVENETENVRLINVDDYQQDKARIVKKWRYPENHRDVTLSRNFETKDKKIISSNTVYDVDSKDYSEIQDSYLRKALKKNKDNDELRSIISTIQLNQNTIREYSPEKSFIVQGCAGSGKTMVLLHRLRYLLHNDLIKNKEYLYLIPGVEYGNFINGISSNFGLNKKYIKTCHEFYKNAYLKITKISDKKFTDVMANELVFPYSYLSLVYSKSFIQEAYRTVLTKFEHMLGEYTGIFNKQFSDLYEFEKLLIDEKIENTTIETIGKIKALCKDVETIIDTDRLESIEDIKLIEQKLNSVFNEKRHEFELEINNDPSTLISDNDERILNNELVKQVKEEIKTQSVVIQSTPPFLKPIQEKKLEVLNNKYNDIIAKIKLNIFNEERRKKEGLNEASFFVTDGVSLQLCREILENIQNVINEYIQKQNSYNLILNSFGAEFQKKYEKEIKALNDVNLKIIDFTEKEENYIEQLAPVCKPVKEILQLCKDLFKTCEKQFTNKERTGLEKNYKLLLKTEPAKVQSHLNSQLFNKCKNLLKKEFDITLCDLYKHYWYLKLYSLFLTTDLADIDDEIRKYIFIDEAQDLSGSEIELINKINTKTAGDGIEEPVLNLFGDTSQLISEHGIKSWSDCPIVTEVNMLQENFRNTNQIIEYCNTQLGMDMKKVAVDMENVDEYNSLENLIKAKKLDINDYDSMQFIVKDEYKAADLLATFKNLYGKIYQKLKLNIKTVKAVKGLEFKEVYVFDTDMTNNERYIAYTRALKKLTVMKTLPKLTEHNSLIQNGADIEEFEE